MKFTPPPWTVHTYNGPMYQIVRSRTGDETPRHSTEANARVITVAPEAIYELQALLDWYKGLAEPGLVPDGLGPILKAAARIIAQVNAE